MMYGQLCAEFYDADKKFAANNELKLYKELFSKNDSILEPMCGSGRLLIPLVQQGYNVHGIDNSAYMLKRCRERANSLGADPVLYEGNIENYPFEYQFQYIIIPLGSFQLLYPRRKAYKTLEKFRALLISGGKLIMDLFIPWEVMYKNGNIKRYKRSIRIQNDEFIEIDSLTTTNKFEQHMYSTNHYIKYSENKSIAEENEQMDILWYFPYEMELILEKYGFKNIKRINRIINCSGHITFIATA